MSSRSIRASRSRVTIAQYPGAVKTFTSKADGAGNTIAASHINDIQDEVTAIEDGLLNGTAPVNSSRITAASLQIAGASTFTGSVVLSSLVTAAAQPRAHVFHGAVQSVSSVSTASLTFDSELFDVGGFHSTATNPDRVTVPAGGGGLYYLCGHTFVRTTGVSVILYLNQNSTRLVAHQFVTGTDAATASVSGIYALLAGDVIRFEVESGGSTMSFGSASAGYENRLMAMKVW